MDRRHVAELMTAMHATWPRFADNEAAERLWVDDLAPLRHDTAWAAFRLLRRGQKFPPAPAEFDETYRGVLERERYEPDPRAALEAEPLPARPTAEQTARVHDLCDGMRAGLRAQAARLHMHTRRRPDPPPPVTSMPPPAPSEPLPFDDELDPDIF
jgi:hypothetical protein